MTLADPDAIQVEGPASSWKEIQGAKTASARWSVWDMSGYQASFRNSIVRTLLLVDSCWHWCHRKSIWKHSLGISCLDSTRNQLHVWQYSGKSTLLSKASPANAVDFFPTLQSMSSLRCCTIQTQSQKPTLKLGLLLTPHL